VTRFAVILALLVTAGIAHGQDTGTFTPDQMRAQAIAALGDGNWDRAEVFARALLIRDPDDRVALSILSRLALEAGVADDAQTFGADLFRVSETPAARFDAARLTALAAARQGRWIAAMFWLRRAALQADTAENRAQLIEDGRALREASPLAFSLTAGLSPSDNVNGGARQQFYPIPGSALQELVPPDERALSGWAGSIDAGLSWRLHETGQSRTTVALRLYARGVILSDEAEQLIADETRDGTPRVTAEDFSTGLAEVDLTHLIALNQGVGSVSLSFGRIVTGLDSFYGTQTIRLGRSWDWDSGVGLDLTAEREWRRFDGTRPTETRSTLAARWSWPVGEDNRLSFGVDVRQTDVNNPVLRNQGAGFDVGFAPGRMIGPAQISLQAGYDFTDYPDYRSIVIIPGGRQDHRLSASLTAAFPEQAVAGFMPVITLGWSDTDSNIARYDSNGLSLDLSLRSTF
jgi:hypothetical protein